MYCTQEEVFLFAFGCTGSLLLCEGFLWLQRVAAPLELRCIGFAMQGLLLLWSRVNEGSVVVAQGLSCSTACEIFLDRE